ncbi:MAG: tRNA (adenosine(37)-N6)-threonylcarbamoyltransferase complex dimerization subunit type 1 TsaB [Candidatus Dormibacterales bacterium]
MILAIDTSSARAGLALLDGSGAVLQEQLHASGRSLDLPGIYRSMAAGVPLTKVAVATGPGSFTGLRTGVSFALGLAMGFGIPIVPLRTLSIQAARASGPVLAVSEAGRGRVYYQAGRREPELGEPAQLPAGLSVVGWLRPATEDAMRAAGLVMKPEEELLPFGAAVARLLETAPEAPYGSLKIHYMQSISAPA